MRHLAPAHRVTLHRCPALCWYYVTREDDTTHTLETGNGETFVTNCHEQALQIARRTLYKARRAERARIAQGVREKYATALTGERRALQEARAYRPRYFERVAERYAGQVE